MSSASSPSTPPDAPHAAPDYHDSGEHLNGSAEEVIAHIGATSTAGRSDRVDDLDDGAEDTTRIG